MGTAAKAFRIVGSVFHSDSRYGPHGRILFGLIGAFLAGGCVLVFCTVGLVGDRLPMSFPFSEENTDVLFALSQYDGDCDIDIVYEVKNRTGLTFKFTRRDIDILVLRGHEGSLFIADKSVLFF